MTKLIAVSGVKGSGKDITSDMFQYCLSVPKPFRQYWIYKFFRKFIHLKYKKIAFADPLKGMLAVLLNIPVEKFNNREFKENYVINLNTLKVFPKANSNNTISDSRFTKLAKNLDLSLFEYDLTIRQLMQYFGTSIARTFFGENVWINSTLKLASKNIIISDLRFKNELEEVKKLKGICVYVNRPNYTFGQHASEREMEELLNNNKYDHVINNNGSIKDLFNKVKAICN